MPGAMFKGGGEPGRDAARGSSKAKDGPSPVRVLEAKFNFCNKCLCTDFIWESGDIYL